ncbi:bridge-like lipid transfer protein family member 1 isoform X2 [Mercenaria mercenaria]|uniref:bridge-like lipid transfer protein family member 1 isoform X2 n=1 Tax=Mercenaria mercenaria TaxID=6596 RepID=UPI00234F07E5|nr:bridge-like lipid transfer protein family member 1 isoform X2 [Mercenaria mercenaria]
MADRVTNETESFIKSIETAIPKSTLYWFFISLAAAIIWTIYLAYYNSRVMGLIATLILNKFSKYGRINIGSISLSVLTGKLMFRGIHYITEDFSVRIEYGWIIFKWWRPYVYKELGEDMSHSETRLFSFIETFEVHVYNRSATYSRLEKLFGLSTELNSEEDEEEEEEEDNKNIETTDDKPGSPDNGKKSRVDISKKNLHWRDLIPVCKFDITTCRFVFGNNLVPNTLIVHLDDSHVTYTTTPPSTPFDLFMHDLKVKSDSLRIMFVPSDKYQMNSQFFSGKVEDEPPRMMGEGFVLMQSTEVKLHYYMDEPGLVPYEPERVELADGETLVRRTYPTIALDVECGKNTDFNYGPWADRQREYLWKFFYPSDHQPMEPTKVAEPGEKRQFKTFEFRMNIVAEATNDVLFTKNSETQAVHMNMGQGSYIEASIPWVTEETGYTSVVRGQLLLLEATTSMKYRSLLECETLDFNISVDYPLEWNDHQNWTCSFTACKATVYLIFAHKLFISDLIDDWSTKSVPDVVHFVPYTYNINILINQFELVTLCNEYNWIDTSSHNPENAHLAFCGEMFDLSLQLPYIDFLPATNSIGFIFKVETVFCRIYLPENNTSRHVIIALSENMKIVDRDGNIQEDPFCYDIKKQWRRLTERSAGWIDCWMTSNVALSITYKYHPMPPLLKTDTHHIILPSMEDLTGIPESPAMEEFIPLNYMRPESLKVPENFDAGVMDSDLISVELEVAPSVLCAYGSLLRNFLHVKENYLGEDQTYTDFYDSPDTGVESKETEGLQGPLTEKEVVEGEFDPRKYRPFAVTVSVTLHDIQGHLIKNCNLETVPCPSVYIERVGFELDKRYHETKLQVLISPAILIARDSFERETEQAHLTEGHLALSGLQVRGHAMFSHKDLPLESETLEYAWLVEAVVGDLSGRLTSPQIQNIVEFVQTFIMLVEDSENSLQRAVSYQLCQHMVPQHKCKKLQPLYNIPCPSSEDIKYRMTRASVDSLNIYLVESGSALNVQVFPVRLATCNLHGENTRAGITGLVEHISLKQYISTGPIRHDTSQPEVWIESGGISLGPIKAEAAMALPNQDFHALQNEFLLTHDGSSMRLWFLWPEDTLKVPSIVIGKCGCIGGCTFFGNNKNGVGFFHPKKFHEVTPNAVCKVTPEGNDPGFGQSLLHKNKLVFEIGSTAGWGTPNKEFTFTRGYMSTLTTPDTPGTSITVIEEYTPSQNTLKPGNVTDTPISPSPRQLARSATVETQSTSSFTGETVGDNISINPFDTLKSTDSSVLREGDRSIQDELTSKSARSISQSSSSSPPPFSPTMRSSIAHSPSSRSSMQSPSGHSSIHSTSPTSLRLKQGPRYDPTRQRSVVSLDSEMYFSAEEDALSSSDPNFSLKQPSFTDIGIEGESVTWTLDETSPKLVMNKSVMSQVDTTVIERQDSTSSTNSTLSYMSADTDPDETMSGGVPEEFSMVDLHSQVKNDITKSPVLLPCYSNHMTRLQCNNWVSPAPFPGRYHSVQTEQSQFSLSSVSQSVQLGQSQICLPHFVKIKQGFSTRIMKAKDLLFPAESHDGTDSWDNIEEPLLDTVDGMENASRTTATVKLRGSVDVLITPLLLESFQRLCEAVTPTLTNLHPSSILDGLHSRCLDRLKSQNRLKKVENSTDAETPDIDTSPTQRQFSSESRSKGNEIKTSSYQALITLPRINICTLQAGMVEELISFSALDNIHEITCVSLMGVSIEDVRCQLLSNSHSCKTQNSVLPNLLNSSPASNRGRLDTSETEREDLPEVLREEDVGTVDIKAIHFQLRRLLKDSNFSDGIVLTAIPEQKSKVMFTFENDATKLFSPVSAKSGSRVKRSSSARTEKDKDSRRPSLARHVSHDPPRNADDRSSLRNVNTEDNPFDAAPQPKLLRQRSINKDKPEDVPRKKSKDKIHNKHSIGYIMFECGLEDIGITAVRRLGYKDKNAPDIAYQSDNLETSVNETQKKTKSEMEGSSSSKDSKSSKSSKGKSQDQGGKAEGTATKGQGAKQTGLSPTPVSQPKTSSQSSKGNLQVGIDPLGVGPVEMYTSSNSVHSWDSRISIPSDSGELMETKELVGDASSGVLHLKTIWFNFAAPPPLPIKRKADFTKYDWNLLSTATPAINAWLSPFDRLMTAARTLAQELTHRTNSVMACIMTEGLEYQSIHMPYKSKYSKITNFSRTLQEDASCQLLTVLRRYIHKQGTCLVEQAVSSETIPQLITIQKGILALTRQWKNVLYMPQISQFNFKSRKHRPYTVSFAVPPSESEEEMEFDDEGNVQIHLEDENVSLIDEDVNAKKTGSNVSLGKRQVRSGSQPSLRQSSPQRYGDASKEPVPNLNISRTSSWSGAQQTRKAHQAHRTFESPQRETNPHMTSLLRNDSVYSFQSASAMSGDHHVGPTPPATPYKRDFSKSNMLKSKVDDLYRWMTMQQSGGFASHPLDEEPVGSVKRQDSFLEAFGRGLGAEESHTDVNMEHFTLGTSIMQLADARNLFKPFLQSIGLHVENVRPTAMLKNFGGNLSLQGRLEVLKIQIADSVKTKGKGKGKGKRSMKISDAVLDSSAFLCEMFTMKVSMRDVTDFEKRDSEDGDRFKKFPFKFAMHKLEAKPATLQVNLLVNCQAVTQYVDMPLLRLIHQFVTMIGNVNETRIELKQGHSSVDWIRTHRKQDSKGSSSSAETVHSEASRTELTRGKNTEASPSSSRTNLASEARPTDALKSHRSKPSISSFKFPFDTIRPERLSFPSSVKKTNIKFAKDKKGQKMESKSPGTHSHVVTPPQSLNLSDSVHIDLGDMSSPAVMEKTIVDEIKEETPHCWRTLYHLLQLYSTMPETKKVDRKSAGQQLPVIEEEQSDKANMSTPSGSVKTRIDLAAEEEAGLGPGTSSSGEYENTPLARSTFSRTRFKQSIYIGDSIPLVVFGIAKVEKVKILAVLSGLKLEAEMRNVHGTGTIKEKVKGFLQRKSSESSFTAHVGHTMLVLLEGPSLQTVVTVNVGRSQALHTTVKRRGKGHNSALVSIGEIEVDIPQHPVVLHGMLTRGTTQLSSTLQEFRRPIYRARNTEMDYGTIDSKGSGADTSRPSTLPRPQRIFEAKKSVTLHIHLKAILQGITIGASLLPSLRAQHKTGPITISGITLKKAKFTLDLPHHTLSFKSKVKTMETSIPSSASIDLPPIHVYADYRHYSANAPITEDLTEGLMLKEGNYLNAVAEVGMFEHSLTTDLLNHLVFVQKVFMKEVNELLQKVSGGDRPVPIWSDTDQAVKSSPEEQILYSFHFRLKGIQITATTPTASAVRLETEAIDLEVSNRVQMASQEANPNLLYEDNQKVFIKAQIDLSLSLGQLIKNPMFEEADPEFQTMAFFKTKISVRNALQDEMIPGVSTDQEALLINMSRPIVLAQPLAFDKAVLVWLNYKNAYEYWTEQRLALNKEIQSATRQVIDRLPQMAPATQQALSTLFLQLTVDDIGLCLPVTPFNSFVPSKITDTEPGVAVVLTIESTQICACSSGSLVSKGKFKGFCLRIAEDFETSLDDWKPSQDDTQVMNACVVPEGTYEVCSRTTNPQSSDPNSNAKWILNIKWEMQGIDVHLDTNLGKRLSDLGNTLTSLTGEEEDEYLLDPMDERLDVSLEDLTEYPQQVEYCRRASVVPETLPKFVFDTSLDPKKRARLLEKEMNEQAKIVQDLRELGASQTTIESETRKLEELKGVIFNDFRREVLGRIKKQSERASVIKDKLGIGSNPAHIRTRSYGGRADDKHRESAPPEFLKPDSLPLRSLSETSHVTDHSGGSRVQFGETTSSTYTPPITPEGTPLHRPSNGTSAPRRAVSLAVPTFRRESASTSSSASGSSSATSTESSASDDEAKKDVFDRDSYDTSTVVGSEQISASNPSIGSGGSKSVIEPNVDFELDVKVHIDSGKCVLHPKDRDEENKRNKREKTPVTGLEKLRKQESASSIPSSKNYQAPQLPTIEKTVFFLPGVDVKVHYNSKTDHWSSPASTLSTEIGPDILDSSVKCDDSISSTCRSRPGMKKANLYAWFSLQSLPKTMVISPCLLDYLEQALEPIPISLTSQISKKESPTALDNLMDTELNSSYASLGGPVLLGSFPVDVIVFLRVEPSSIRFNCLPESRVECLLQVPSLEFVFSTKRSDIDASVGGSDGTPPLKAKFGKKLRERNLSGGKESKARSASTTSDLGTMTSSGGLSVTGCLTDFSLYIFHPYGGGQRKTGIQTSPRYLGSIEEQTILGDTNRKDSLSLNLEYVNLNISRTRKLEVRMDRSNNEKFNIVRFSTVCDIGTAAFKYDMRRLSEILSFPKAWYRRNLARRLFLGDESWLMEDEGKRRFKKDRSSLSSTSSSPGGMDSLLSPPFTRIPCTSSPALHAHSFSDFELIQGHQRSGSSGDKNTTQISAELKSELARRMSERRGASAPQSPIDAYHSPDFHHTTPGATPSSSQTRMKTQAMLNRRNSQQQNMGTPLTRMTSERKSAGWQTLVLYAVNLKQLDVNVNMSNVMGNTVWNTQDIQSQGRLSIDSTGHKDLSISAGLGGSHLDSRGGVIGGNVDLQGISTYFECNEDPKLGKDPLHEAGVSMYAIEGRVDYMGSSVLMTRLSDMSLSVRDEWKIDKTQEKTDAPLATTRTALLFAHGDLRWDKFHILISRSTTPDLIKMVSKLDEFIMQQFTSSKRALGAIGPIPGSGRHKVHEKHTSADEESLLSELRHHRHWQKALGNITGCRFSMLPAMLPKEGMILGGTLTLRGNNLTLGCFHGINFRSKSWALFTMNEPYICFATEAQKTIDEGTHVVQDLTFYVGHDLASHQEKNMANVLKISRGHSMPPTFTNTHEWFHYAFSNSEIKDLDAFPRMQRAGSESPSDYRKRKYMDYSHDSEMIFALPSLQLQLRTTHQQAEQEPVDDDPKPVVECSFVTEFEDHIYVAMDAEVFLFLHDLVMAYIQEKDKGTRTSVVASGGKSSKPQSESEKKKVIDPVTVLQQDWREYECKTWHLEPTVRLLHWASKQIDPVGVDYILQKLGFSHARVTIPKWMQRGFMDPSDKILSMLVNKLIVMLRETSNTESPKKL